MLGLLSDPKQTLIEAVTHLEDAFNQGDVEKIRSRMTTDHLAITSYAQFSNLEELVQALPSYKITQRQLSNIDVRILSQDVAVASYRAVIEGTYKDQKLPRQVWVVAVWVKQNGQWREATYQETSKIASRQ
jgi:uncharacterized protein (TIGR02246 family)